MTLVSLKRNRRDGNVGGYELADELRVVFRCKNGLGDRLADDFRDVAVGAALIAAVCRCQERERRGVPGLRGQRLDRNGDGRLTSLPIRGRVHLRQMLR